MVYSSFLVRCWLQGETAQHQPGLTFLVEHVQTGGHFRTANLADALSWIESTNEELRGQPNPAQESDTNDD